MSSIEYDETTGTWTLCLVDRARARSTLEADAVISAVGQLNRPQLPNIEGRERFAGPSFHSARWDHTVDLAGKRVGVIGTGCSAAQFVPIIAEQVDHLEVFQRTPNWQFPVPHYHHEVPDGFQWLLRHVPYYRQWYRFWLFWRSAELLRPMAEVDPEWPGQERSVSELNDMLRDDAHRGARGPVPGAARPAAQGHPAVPAGRQADHRRQRRRGRRRCTATTSR